jgi:hypothetical protein
LVIFVLTKEAGNMDKKEKKRLIEFLTEEAEKVSFIIGTQADRHALIARTLAHFDIPQSAVFSS